jgi:hypothetical protein
MKLLPIGIQSFAKLREGGFLYVDKTKELHQLITSGQVFFLSRPRRFGKSLLLSTLESLFKGHKTLFEGLYIYDKMDWTQACPVIKLDWSSIKHAAPEDIEQDTSAFLSRIADEYQLKLTRQYASSRLEELLKLLHHKTGQRSVILIDEYDMPIIDALDEPEKADAMRNFLQSFYKILKSADEHLRFVFLTGVSRFSGVSIFSGLNNLNDLTMDEKYASICGYTQEELDVYFPERIDEVARHVNLEKTQLMDEIRTWYDGYSWDGKTSVYNPFSTLLFFDKKQFGNYWFRTGTPTFLIGLLKKNNHIRPVLEPVEIGPGTFDNFDPLAVDETSLLFQTGYLTVKQKTFVMGQPEYTLAVPNYEVRNSLLVYLLHAYSDYPLAGTEDLKRRMQRQLCAGDARGLEQSLREMVSYIPYPLHIKHEAYYHSMMLLWLRLLGFDILGEVTTDIGRIDAVWQFPSHTFIAEVKCQAKKASTETLLDEAIRQIKEKRYADRFIGKQQVSLLAIAFAGKEIACRICGSDF